MICAIRPNAHATAAGTPCHVTPRRITAWWIWFPDLARQRGSRQRCTACTSISTRREHAHTLLWQRRIITCICQKQGCVYGHRTARSPFCSSLHCHYRYLEVHPVVTVSEALYLPFSLLIGPYASWPLLWNRISRSNDVIKWLIIGPWTTHSSKPLLGCIRRTHACLT